MAHYPIIAWPVDLSGTHTVTVLCNGSSEVLDLSTTADMHGFGLIGNGLPQTLGQRMATVLQTHSQISGCSAAYEVVADETSVARCLWTITFAGATQPTITAWSSLETAQHFGFRTASPVAASAGVLPASVSQHGVWQAGVELSGQLRPVRHHLIEAESRYTSEYTATYLGAQRALDLSWEAVDAAHVYRHRAQDGDFADVAGRAELDDGNILEDFAEAYCRGRTMRVWMNATDAYRTVRRPSGGPVDIDRMAVRRPDDHRRYSVDLRFRDTT